MATQLVDVVAAADSGDTEFLQHPAPSAYAVFNSFRGDRLVMGSCGRYVFGGLAITDRLAGIGQRQELGGQEQPLVISGLT
ncbi:MAG TPA: hypothetical protein VFA63_03510 [Pseudonocardiaceae bacterium]|nr:hypothetical protein [Pseudonocardiaceae bacterium]